MFSHAISGLGGRYDIIPILQGKKKSLRDLGARSQS